VRSAVLVVALLAACGQPRDVVVVGAKNFTEQRVLGELVAQTVESLGLRARRMLDLGGTFVCDAALRAGQIDVYVEYTGTALAAILKEPPSGRDARAVYARVQAAYAKDGLVWTAPLGFENTFAMVMRGDEAQRLGVRSISDAARHANAWGAAFGYEFRERADGYPGLERTYGLHFADVRIMDLGLIYRALVDHQVDVVAGNSTDGQIDSLRLAVLDDDRHYFPPYEAAPIVRRATLDRYPPLERALTALGGTISVEAMRRANAEVNRGRQSLAGAARALRQGGTPPGP